MSKGLSSGLVKKLLILAFGVLLVLIGLLYQVRQDSEPTPSIEAPTQDRVKILTASLLQQRRYFQRCWLKTNYDTESTEPLTWQIYLKIDSNGKVKEFSLLNKSMFDAETEKCLREISYRLRFPSFDGEDISLTAPIVITPLNENH